MEEVIAEIILVSRDCERVKDCIVIHQEEHAV